MLRFQLKDEEYKIKVIQIQYPDPSPYSTISSLFDDLTAIVFTGVQYPNRGNLGATLHQTHPSPLGEVWCVQVDGSREIHGNGSLERFAQKISNLLHGMASVFYSEPAQMDMEEVVSRGSSQAGPPLAQKSKSRWESSRPRSCWHSAEGTVSNNSLCEEGYTCPTCNSSAPRIPSDKADQVDWGEEGCRNAFLPHRRKL
jgi:hypothetical protein